MKNIYLLILAGLTWHSAAMAQNLKITVRNDASEPLPYAFVYVKGKPVAVTDSLGIALIPSNRFADNDTIYASFLGTEPQWVVYDKALKQVGKHDFVLPEIYSLTIDEPVIVRGDIEKLFRKYTNFTSALNYNCTLDARFEAVFHTAGHKDRSVSGQLKAGNQVWSKDFSSYRQMGWFHRPMEFVTQSDTSGISGLLRRHSFIALNSINSALQISGQKKVGSYRPYYGYLGKKDGCRIFRISYPEYSARRACQILLYVDEHTKDIRSAEVEFVNQETNKYKVRITCDCIVFTHKRPRMDTVLIPVNLHYQLLVANEPEVDIKIYDPLIKHKKW